MLRPRISGHSKSGQEKAVDWIERKATTFLQEHSLAVNKFLGKKYK